MYIGNFEITKKEVIGSISIIAILLAIGLLISGKISEWQMDKNEVYNKAVKIESADMFEYGMRTNVGNAFVYGNFKAIDTVTYPELGGEYMYVQKVKERYTKHTRRIAHTRTVDGKTETYYTTETYWTWDQVGSEDKKCNRVSFLGVEFDANKIDMPSALYISTINESSYVRYQYYGTKTEYTGTIFAVLKDNTIADNTPFYANKSIQKTVEHLESGTGIIVFWIFWTILTVCCVLGFYYIDNRWLE